MKKKANQFSSLDLWTQTIMQCKITYLWSQFFIQSTVSIFSYLFIISLEIPNFRIMFLLEWNICVCWIYSWILYLFIHRIGIEKGIDTSPLTWGQQVRENFFLMSARPKAITHTFMKNLLAKSRKKKKRENTHTNLYKWIEDKKEGKGEEKKERYPPRSLNSSLELVVGWLWVLVLVLTLVYVPNAFFYQGNIKNALPN